MSSASQEKTGNSRVARPPVVVIMGHVDHGKTTLLDYLRQTRIAEREAGGITQATSSYEVEKNGKRITFIDTPGHAAFTGMRKRGAQVADIAILIVAADDGVKPQTKEAISIIKQSETPFLVAINKIDKNNADVERTKQDLLANEVYLEKYGGDTSWVAISAKTGEGVDELLDTLLLMAEIEDPTYDASLAGQGFVLESERDSRKGIVVSLIVKEGVVHVGDEIGTPTAKGKVRTLEDFLGRRVQEIKAGAPATILGFETLPLAGEEFCSGKGSANAAAQQQLGPRIQQQLEKVEGESVIPAILKADVSGSLEALSQIISSLAYSEVRIRIISQEVGDVTDSDVKDAHTMGAKIIAFNVKTNKSAETLARAQGTQIITSNIIYKLVEQLDEIAETFGKEPDRGVLEVLATFSKKNKRQLIGGRVTQGMLTLNEKFEVVRQEALIGTGRIVTLKEGRQEKTKIESGECGLMVDSGVEIQVGDVLVIRG